MYFFEKEFKNEEKVVYGLKRIFGIGYSKARKICNYLGISEVARFKDINNELVRGIIQKSLKEGKIMVDLKGEINENIKKNIKIRNYKGIRFLNGLPLRGQRTKTNAKTAKNLLKRKI